jgi:TPP-dependent pyruvate/acetoin dehydrogenase alpha subunit
MMLIRVFEGTVARLARDGQVPGFVHLSSGGEAAATGVVAALDGRDVVFSGHRAHGHLLARGSDPAAVLAEIAGRSTGLCRGWGGSMHLVDTAVGFLGATGVVGGTIPLALGAAYRQRQRGGVSAVFFGDGATTTGIFHECLNLAALWGLPVLFCCENNGYAEFTARAEQSPVAEAHHFAGVYGMARECLDATDVGAVHDAAVRAVETVRSGRPFFLELRVVRMSGHYEGDAQAYRSRAEREALAARDPVARLRERLRNHWFVPEAEIAAIEGEVERTVREAERKALEAPLPEPVAPLG